jgi:DNA-binding NarL/FixJ family response regulator
MAEGRSNTAITRALTITEKAVSKHIGSIFLKLDLPTDSSDDHRRVRAVLTYLHDGRAHDDLLTRRPPPREAHTTNGRRTR